MCLEQYLALSDWAIIIYWIIYFRVIILSFPNNLWIKISYIIVEMRDFGLNVYQT